MHKSKNSIAVIMSAYNAEKYIYEQVTSILSQKDVSVKLWIRDDGSKDGTVRILREKFGDDFRVVITSGVNLGAARSFIQATFDCDFECDYYGFSDADDVWIDKKLSMSVEAISARDIAKPIAVATQLTVVDANLKKIGVTAPPEIGYKLSNSLVQTVASGASIVMNRTAFKLVRTYRPRNLVMHDAWVYLLITALGEFIYLQTPTILYRQHDQNVFGTSHGFWKRVQNRWNRLVSPSPYVAQAAEFLSVYESQLSQEDWLVVKKYVNYNNSLFNRILFAIFPTVQMQTRKANMFQRLLILMGKA